MSNILGMRAYILPRAPKDKHGPVTDAAVLISKSIDTIHPVVDPSHICFLVVKT